MGETEDIFQVSVEMKGAFFGGGPGRGGVMQGCFALEGLYPSLNDGSVV